LAIETPQGTRKGKIIALTVSVLFCFLTLEIGLRLAGALAYPSPDVDAWFMDADDDNRPAHRLLLVGDSFTQGQGEVNYPDQLVALLAQTQPEGTVGVYNAGIGNANTYGVRQMVHCGLDAASPQVVVLLAGGANKFNHVGLDAFVGRDTAWTRVDDGLLGLRSYRLLRQAMAQILPQWVHAPEEAYTFIQDDLVLHEAKFRQRREMMTGGPSSDAPALRAGYNALRSGDLARAREAFTSNARDDDPETAFLQGTLAIFEGRVDNAEEHFQRCVALDPGQGVCHFHLGLLDMDMRHDTTPEQTLAHFEQGIEAEPGEASNYWGAIMLAKRHGKRDEQLSWTLACMQAAPDDVGCYSGLIDLAATVSAREDIVAQLRKNARRSVVARDYLTWLGSHEDPALLQAWIAADLTLVAERVRASGARLILQNYPDSRPENTVIADTATKLGLALVDNESRFSRLMAAGEPRNSLFMPDGHCTQRGYGLMAENILATMRREGMLPGDSQRWAPR
jgi:tetratricopeptide (TPR) repeat protein